MIRTIGSGQEGKKLLTLLLDGNHTGEIPDGLFESESELEILAIFNPTRKHFPLPIFKMQKLRLLVLRGCEFLESIEIFFQLRNPENPNVPEESQSLPPTRISDPSPSRSPGLVTPNILLQKLTVFEISGPSSLKTIPDNFFKNMPHLKNLNLSFLQIEFFSGNKKLQILNLSRSRIERLPLIHSLENLKSLSLRDCAVLLRIRKSGSLKRLQILDISGATKVEEFLDPSLEGLQSLVVLDVSRTAIRQLPSNIGNPRYLYLSGCSRLKELPPIEGLSKVEVLDLSGSCHLEEIRNEFFKNTKCLRELNLSKTSVKSLPFLSCLGNLRRLLLSQCLSLEKLENLSSLEELEVLDLSGCKALMEIEDKSFDKMNRLHSLDLSGIQLDRLPSMSKLLKLKKLSVKDCPKLTNVSGLEELPALEILDHSGTTLKPSLSFHPDCNPIVIGPTSLSIENIDPLNLNRLICSMSNPLWILKAMELKSQISHKKVWISATGAFLIGKAKQMLMKRRLVSL
ncbi:hypothetical protein Pfo_029652 [Paulownia fortunei]|nr:hypothetical protein Pfo_029652 [Paulownia fortunei]